jgi:hypothetical protein
MNNLCGKQNFDVVNKGAQNLAWVQKKKKDTEERN